MHFNSRQSKSSSNTGSMKQEEEESDDYVEEGSKNYDGNFIVPIARICVIFVIRAFHWHSDGAPQVP